VDILVFFEPGLTFLALILGFVTFENFFAFPFTAFLRVNFGREGALETLFDLGRDLAPTLAFLGLALVDDERWGFTCFLVPALDFVGTFFLDLGWGLAFDFVLDLAPVLAFLGLALVDDERWGFTCFLGTALDFVGTFFLDLGWGLAFDLGLALAAMCDPPNNMIDNRPV